MNEQILSHELHRVLDASPVPADLFPPGLTARRTSKRRSRWLVVAAAAVALVIFSLTPVGGNIVDAAGEFLMQHTIRLVITDDTKLPAPFVDITNFQPGQSVTTEEQGAFPRRVYTGIRLSDLKQSEPDLPLPAYLPPTDEARVIKVEQYKLGHPDQLELRGFGVSWKTEKGSLHYDIDRRIEPMAQKELERIRSGKVSPITIFTNDHAAKMERKQVTLKGQSAMATYLRPDWILFWAHDYGTGSLMGTDMPLDELLKVAESLPSLK
ncbi:MAG: hypothetical protein JWN15_4325 [Firmicutes bacterium]|nr:hypothetical protein [Bacillota bacterium]